MKVRRNLLIALSLLSISASAQRIKGSDTVLPVAQQTAERFMNQHPDTMASRPIKFSEKMKIKSAGEDVAEIVVAYDALAVVAHPSNPVKQLTRQQLEDIFRGKITNWKQVGGDDRKIVVYSRETSSGTYEFFHARNGRHYPVGQPDQRSHRICRTCLCVSTCQNPFRILRRKTLCSPHSRECHQQDLSHRPPALLLLQCKEESGNRSFDSVHSFSRRTGHYKKERLYSG